jgi:desulfoferrodoxin (superoxide reductase-like protein)
MYSIGKIQISFYAAKLNLFISITYLLNPLSQLVEALFRKGSESATNCDIIRNNIERSTAMEFCNRHNLWQQALYKEDKMDLGAFNM